MQKHQSSPSVNDSDFVDGADEDSLSAGRRIYPHSQTSPSTLITQAAPLLIGYPIRRVVSWFIFLQFFALLNDKLPDMPLQRLIALILSLAFTKTAMWIILPLLFIVIKWYLPTPLLFSPLQNIHFYNQGCYWKVQGRTVSIVGKLLSTMVAG